MIFDCSGKNKGAEPGESHIEIATAMAMIAMIAIVASLFLMGFLTAKI